MSANAGYISKGDGVRSKLVELRAIIGGQYDPLRAVWEEQATAKDRRLLLAMAGLGTAQAGLYAGRAWPDLPADTRAAIAGGLRRWKAWAEKLA